MNRALILAAALGLAACSPSSDSGNTSAAPASPGPITTSMAVPPSEPQNTDDPLTFVPLKSADVKDAIHRALTTGQTQRWQDGKLSGYAVPSQTTGANGCRSIRYTVDQRAAGQFESITACDASR